VQSDRWNHTAQLLCLQANLHRDPKQKPYEPADFHPLLIKAKAGLPLTSENIGDLKPLFKKSVVITVAQAQASLGEATMPEEIPPVPEPLFTKSLVITVDDAKRSLES
jgi:hypothetical protein